MLPITATIIVPSFSLNSTPKILSILVPKTSLYSFYLKCHAPSRICFPFSIVSKPTLNLTKSIHKSAFIMSITKRKLILVLILILVCASLFRVLRITLTTSYFLNPEQVPNTRRDTHSNKILSEKELRFLSDIILQKSPCNLLVFGLEDQYLKLPAINKGGISIFLEDKPEKLIEMTGNVNGSARVYRIRYKTSAKEAYKLLKHARTHSSCSLQSGIRTLTAKCKIALTGLPKEVFKTKWDVIVVDGPGGDGPESPGRMSAIYMAGVLARAGNGTNVVVHDVDRMIEKWFSWEFLSEKNLVSSKGKFWNFKIDQNKNLVSLKKV